MARGFASAKWCALKVADIDSQRMLLRIEKGKGQKDRYAMLPPILLERLRTWWRTPGPRARFCPAAIYFRASIRWIP